MEQTFSTVPVKNFYRVTAAQVPQITGTHLREEAAAEPTKPVYGSAVNKPRLPKWVRLREKTTNVGQFVVLRDVEEGKVQIDGSAGNSYIQVVSSGAYWMVLTLEVGQSELLKLMDQSVAEPDLADAHVKNNGYRDPGWQVFPADPHPLDVSQGAVGNCRVASAMQAIAASDEGRRWLRKLITSADGRHTVMIKPGGGPKSTPQPGALVPVTVSGYIPWSVLDNRPLYLLKGAAPAPGDEAEREPGRHPAALWPAIIEKVLAEHWGGYQKLDGAEEMSVFATLGLTDIRHVNWLSKTEFDTQGHTFDFDGYKAKVLEMAKKGFVLTTSAEGKQHNYALLAVDDQGVVVSDPNSRDKDLPARLQSPPVAKAGEKIPEAAAFPRRYGWMDFFKTFRWVYGAVPPTT